MSWFSELIPFLAPYPPWVKALISGWVLLTAVCVIALLLSRPPPPAPRPAAQAPTEVWLKIKQVEVFDQRLRQACVRVTAKVNDNEFEYPSVGAAHWVQVGPDMSPGLFRLPSRDAYTITFAMVAIANAQDESNEAQFTSQEAVRLHKDQLPHSGKYPLHRLTASPEASSIAAEILFDISTRPG